MITSKHDWRVNNILTPRLTPKAETVRERCVLYIGSSGNERETESSEQKQHAQCARLGKALVRKSVSISVVEIFQTKEATFHLALDEVVVQIGVFLFVTWTSVACIGNSWFVITVVEQE